MTGKDFIHFSIINFDLRVALDLCEILRWCFSANHAVCFVGNGSFVNDGVVDAWLNDRIAIFAPFFGEDVVNVEFYVIKIEIGHFIGPEKIAGTLTLEEYV